MDNKIVKFFKDFINTRNVAFYVALGFAALAFIGGIIASAGASVAECGALPVVLTLIGLLAFIGFSLIGHEWVGAGAVALCGFFSIVAAIINVYSYYLAEIQDLAMTGISVSEILALPGLGALVAAIVILAVSAISANVLAWIRLRKKPEQVQDGKEGE